ncbi:MAG TPA: hypothetical protein VMZ00_09165 [Sporichthya sp.]|nr:hypothetical protein [Sporichthya sp.]
MIGRLASCGCREVPQRCTRPATQEDFLCDVCRAGCNICMKIDPDRIEDAVVEHHGNDDLMEQWLEEGFPDPT